VRSVFLFLTICIGQHLCAQFWQDSTLSGQALQEDLMALKSTIYSTHQDPFFYADSLTFELKLLTLKDHYQGGGSKKDFLFDVGDLLQTLQDSHTYISYQDLIRNLEKNGGRALPIKVRLLDDALYLKNDHMDLIPSGVKLISINGKRFNSLIAQMHDLSILEGNSANARLRISESIFPTLANHILDLHESNTIEYLVAGESTPQTIEYPALTIANFKSKLKKTEKKNPVQFKVEPKNIGVLTISSFSRGSDAKYWKSIRKAFAANKRSGCRKLILDLRGNTGGSSERMEGLFPYLEIQPSNVPANIIARQSQLSIKRNEQTFKGFSKWVLTRFFKKNEDVQNYLKMINLEPGAIDTLYYTHQAEPEKNRFTGDVFLLVDGLTGSASVNFASKFKEKELGAIIGESCLGPQGGTWGNPSPFKLPNSKISINVSTMRFNTTNTFETSPEPVAPHHYVRISAQDLADERDGPMEWVRDRAFIDLLDD